jgi:protein-S-isoprenylcysteine O-methyltransferase Ste14
MTLPWLGVARAAGTRAVPAFAQAMPYAVLRWLAAGVAVWSLLQTLRCWRRMGKDWRMDVSQEKAALITDGLYARIRHPIYAFSVLLMLCTLLVLPTPAMAVLAAVHVVLMNVKARNEERHLLEVHGEPYARYLRGTGRFIPRFGGPGS